KNGFRFVEGPLVQAARQGCVFLADEFNLLTPAVMIGLVPFLSARPGDTFIHPEIKDPITISSGFIFVATGNEDTERGRVKLPQFVDSLLQRFIVSNPSAKDMEGLIEKIMKADYPNINISQLQPTALREFVDRMKEILNIKWSLRDVRRFLRRANDFLGYTVDDTQLPDQIKPITSTDIALSFILSGHTLDEERKNDMIDQTVKIFGGSQRDAKNLAQDRTHYRETFQGNYLVRGHIAMKIEKKVIFPQPTKDALFWIRWTGTPEDQIPHENVLLVGPTCYKATAMEFLLPDNKNVIYMTREMQVSELIGSTSICTPTRFEDSMQSLQMSIRDALISIGYTNKQENGEQIVKDIQQTLKNEIENIERGIEVQNREKRHGVLRGVLYLQMCLNKMREKVNSFQNEINEQQSSSTPGIQITMAFNPSVVTLSSVLGIPLLLRSIHQPPASVLERLNSLLEDPRSLVIAEDTQQIFNDESLLREVNQSRSRSAPISAGFSLAATTTETERMSLSGPILSRFTNIYIEPYRMNIIKQLLPTKMKNQRNDDVGDQDDEDDLKIMTERITENNYDLIEAINDIHRGFIKQNQKVTITEYIRWCKTANSLHKQQNFSPQKAAGIAALRTIVDALPDNYRRYKTKEVLSAHIPQQLNYIIVTDAKERPVQQREDVLICTESSHQQKELMSKISGISIPIHSNAQIDVLDSVIWTRSAVDMADAVLTSIASKAITIFEGSPGRGKTAVAKSVLEALGLKCTRINLSPTTTVEDLFGRDMPQADPEGGGFTTRFVPGPLTSAMNNSSRDTDDQ
ncbi:MAG: hypothetical protein EZS28_036231, partial [Streblomastix strix]